MSDLKNTVTQIAEDELAEKCEALRDALKSNQEYCRVIANLEHQLADLRGKHEAHMAYCQDAKAEIYAEENEQLRTRLAIAVEALEILAAPTTGRDAMEGSPVAREALKKLRAKLREGT